MMIQISSCHQNLEIWRMITFEESIHPRPQHQSITKILQEKTKTHQRFIQNLSQRQFENSLPICSYQALRCFTGSHPPFLFLYCGKYLRISSQRPYGAISYAVSTISHRNAIILSSHPPYRTQHCPTYS